MIVGTAGHVDHGKTALVKALTGVDTDRLKAEKERGITIALGFAYMPGPSGEPIGFVDVPGHDRFVRTMVAGAAGIDFALFVIAADEGVMPQTREHLDVLGILGISSGLVVITKSDRVDGARRDLVTRATAEALAGSALSAAPTLFASAKTGEGIDALRSHIEVAASGPRRRDASGVFRMAVDRAFTLNGVGTVVTGTSLAGCIRIGDSVTVFPGRLKARVRSLHAQSLEVPEATAGQRCALALSGPSIDKGAFAHGAWICEADPLETNRFDAEVRLLASETRPLRQATSIHLHCGASDVCGRVVLLSDDRLQPGSTALAQVVLDRAMPLRHGDRFVLRDQSARRTLGGGMVLDTGAPSRKRRDPHRIAQLVATRPRDPAEALMRRLDLDPGFEDLVGFAGQRGMRIGAADDLREKLGLAVLRAGDATYAHRPAHILQIGRTLIDLLAGFHAEHPEQPGIPGERLRQMLMPSLPKALFAAVCERMVSQQSMTLDGHWLRLPNHEPRIPEEASRLFASALPLIGRARFQPPRVRDMSKMIDVEEGAMRDACRTFARLGKLTEIGRDRFFLRDTVEEMASVARALSKSSEDGRFRATDFRDHLGTGRKTAIEILEFFDRCGLTKREGEWRRAGTSISPPSMDGHA